MKFFFSLVLTAALCWVFEQFFPWYSAAFASFLIAYFFNIRGLASFLAGGLGTGLLWLVWAWIIDYRTESILTGKMASLVGVNEPVYMLMLTFLIGFVTGGFPALSDQSMKRALVKKRREGYYA